jgi:hypothetical protein
MPRRYPQLCCAEPKRTGAFDVVAATWITTAAAIVRRERGADALKDPYATD